MKRTAIYISMLVLLLSFGLVSCDAMFSKNLFSGMTHKKPTATEMAAKTPAQMQTYVDSAANIQQLTDDPALKQAALDALAPYYDPTNPAVDLGSPEAQIAAVVAADISIQTVPDAATFSASVLGQIVATSGSGLKLDTPADITNFVAAILPTDLKDAMTSGAAMPAAFADMIAAFVTANEAYTALGAGIAGTPPAYADGTNLTDSQKNDIAVNAMISGLICAVSPVSGTDLATALWGSLVDPAASNSQITISPTGFSDLTSTGSIANLLDASTLGALLGGK